jgi:hypothetical protein
MTFFLQTGFGESTESFGGTLDNRLAGAGQGNGAAPALFSVLSMLMINAYKRMGNGAILTSSYISCMFLIAAAMYVNDANLLHWGDSPQMEDEHLIQMVQDATDNFAHLVEATGGAIKPEATALVELKQDNGEM